MSASQVQVVPKLVDEEDYDDDEEEEDIDSCCLKYKTLITICLVSLFFGCGFFQMWIDEGDNWVDSLYVMTQIVTTIGYGDITPVKNTTKISTALYVLFVIVFIANILNDVGNALLERNQEWLRGHLRAIGTKKQQSKQTKDKTPVQPIKRSQLQLNNLLASICIFFGFILFGVVFYALYEDITWLDSVYMSVITLSTVGFGDFTPETPLGRGVGIPWMFLGVLSMANMVGCVATTLGALKKRAKSKGQVSQDLLAAIDVSGSGYLTRSEFIRYMVVKQGLVRQIDIDQLKKTFISMDKTGDGKVSLEEIADSFGADEEYE